MNKTKRKIASFLLSLTLTAGYLPYTTVMAEGTKEPAKENMDDSQTFYEKLMAAQTAEEMDSLFANASDTDAPTLTLEQLDILTAKARAFGDSNAVNSILANIEDARTLLTGDDGNNGVDAASIISFLQSLSNNLYKGTISPETGTRTTTGNEILNSTFLSKVVTEIRSWFPNAKFRLEGIETEFTENDVTPITVEAKTYNLQFYYSYTTWSWKEGWHTESGYTDSGAKVTFDITYPVKVYNVIGATTTEDTAKGGTLHVNGNGVTFTPDAQTGYTVQSVTCEDGTVIGNDDGSYTITSSDAYPESGEFAVYVNYVEIPGTAYVTTDEHVTSVTINDRTESPYALHSGDNDMVITLEDGYIIDSIVRSDVEDFAEFDTMSFKRRDDGSYISIIEDIDPEEVKYIKITTKENFFEVIVNVSTSDKATIKVNDTVVAAEESTNVSLDDESYTISVTPEPGYIVDEIRVEMDIYSGDDISYDGSVATVTIPITEETHRYNWKDTISAGTQVALDVTDSILSYYKDIADSDLYNSLVNLILIPVCDCEKTYKFLYNAANEGEAVWKELDYTPTSKDEHAFGANGEGSEEQIRVTIDDNGKHFKGEKDNTLTADFTVTLKDTRWDAELSLNEGKTFACESEDELSKKFYKSLIKSFKYNDEDINYTEDEFTFKLDSTKAGKRTVTVTWNPQGDNKLMYKPITETVEVTLADYKLVFDDVPADVYYNNTQHGVDAHVTANGKTVDGANISYHYTGTVCDGTTYESNAAPTDAGKYTAEVTFTDDNGFTLTETKQFEIKKISAEVTFVFNSQNVEYGKALNAFSGTLLTSDSKQLDTSSTFAETIKAQLLEGLTIIDTATNKDVETPVNVGTYTITTTSSVSKDILKNFETPIKIQNGTLVISAKKITDKFKVTGIYDVVKTGKEQKLKPVVKDPDTGYTLVEGTDYTLSYSAGDYTNVTGKDLVVTITGKGNYTGSIQKTYRITNKKVSPSSPSSPTNTPGSSSSSKSNTSSGSSRTGTVNTGDTSNLVAPMIMLSVSALAIIILLKKRNSLEQ